MRRWLKSLLQHLLIGLAALAKSIKGKMVISVNDIPEMRKAFEGMPMTPLDITYSVGGSGMSNGVSRELSITNFEP